MSVNESGEPEPPPPLEIPTWVPQSVAERACSLYKAADPFYAFGGTIHRQVIRRFVADPRMKNVWDLLRSRKRNGRTSTRQYYFQAVLPEYFRACDQEDHQNKAMAELFYSAVAIAVSDPRGFLRPKAHPKTDGWKKMAERLREDAAEVRKLVEGDALIDKKVQDLLDAAMTYDELTWNPVTSTGKSLFLEGGRGDVEARAYSVVMAGMIQSIFRPPNLHAVRMYGVVATLATVVLDRDVDRDSVREWCNGVWAKRLGNQD